MVHAYISDSSCAIQTHDEPDLKNSSFCKQLENAYDSHNYSFCCLIPTLYVPYVRILAYGKVLICYGYIKCFIWYIWNARFAHKWPENYNVLEWWLSDSWNNKQWHMIYLKQCLWRAIYNASKRLVNHRPTLSTMQGIYYNHLLISMNDCVHIYRYMSLFQWQSAIVKVTCTNFTQLL